MQAYNKLMALLPAWLQEILQKVPSQERETVQEIRLRLQCPIQLTVKGAVYTLPVRYVPTQQQLEDLLFHLCGESMHSCEESISHGFVPLAGGHRVGIGGQYTYDVTGKPVLQYVSSLNIRIARFPKYVLAPFLADVLKKRFGCLIIAGEPGSGKTTVLRSILTQLSCMNIACTVVDERSELMPYIQAVNMSAPIYCDRIEGLHKADGIQMALRVLGPQILLVDELASLQETILLEQGIGCGVDVVATVHARDLKEAENKPQIQYLLQRGLLQYACSLEGRHSPGTLKEGKSYC